MSCVDIGSVKILDIDFESFDLIVMNFSYVFSKLGLEDVATALMDLDFEVYNRELQA